MLITIDLTIIIILSIWPRCTVWDTPREIYFCQLTQMNFYRGVKKTIIKLKLMMKLFLRCKFESGKS